MRGKSRMAAVIGLCLTRWHSNALVTPKAGASIHYSKVTSKPLPPFQASIWRARLSSEGRLECFIVLLLPRQSPKCYAQISLRLWRRKCGGGG